MWHVSFIDLQEFCVSLVVIPEKVYFLVTLSIILVVLFMYLWSNHCCLITERMSYICTLLSNILAVFYQTLIKNNLVFSYSGMSPTPNSTFCLWSWCFWELMVMLLDLFSFSFSLKSLIFSKSFNLYSFPSLLIFPFLSHLSSLSHLYFPEGIIWGKQTKTSACSCLWYIGTCDRYCTLSPFGW